MFGCRTVQCTYFLLGVALLQGLQSTLLFLGHQDPPLLQIMHRLCAAQQHGLHRSQIYEQSRQSVTVRHKIDL